jgi:RNA-splicing ligase RtcB
MTSAPDHQRQGHRLAPHTADCVVEAWAPEVPSCLAEEAAFAHDDVDQVVASCERSDLVRRVARLRPFGVVGG